MSPEQPSTRRAATAAVRAEALRFVRTQTKRDEVEKILTTPFPAKGKQFFLAGFAKSQGVPFHAAADLFRRGSMWAPEALARGNEALGKVYFTHKDWSGGQHPPPPAGHAAQAAAP